MRDTIINHLVQLEQERDIKILMAVESGSRAWGCPSPDSDYDVRIVFKRPKTDYLEIDDKPDTINYFHGELLDINGWDIKKVLKLLRKSNATSFEWAQSPIVYREVGQFRNELLKLSKDYFQPRHSLNHYRGIAKNSFAALDSGTIKLKKLFYVLRPLMAAKWIIEKMEIPPMDIPKLIEIIKDDKVINHIKELLLTKEKVNEDFVYNLTPFLKEYIEASFEDVEHANIEDIPRTQDSSDLNRVFQSIISA